MKPSGRNIGRHVRVFWPGAPEHGQVGQITQAMQDNYVIAIGCVLITLPPESLPPESLTPVSRKVTWVDDREGLDT